MNQPHFLDDRQAIAKLDEQAALTSIEMIGSQVQHIWEEAQSLTSTIDTQQIKNVVVAGMGGSALPTHVIQTVFKDELKVPVIIAPDYTVPHFVDKHTLVIASSYSGSTEETLAAAADAQAKGAQIMGITSGGKLAAFLKENGYPALVFEPQHNPNNSPRMALGYSVFGQMALFNKAGLLQLDQTIVGQVLETIARVHLNCGVDIEQENNPAKLLAFEFVKRMPVIMVAEHLEGVAHVFANQLNESAKTFAEYRVIPELNHHLMEGLQFPEDNQHYQLWLSVHSDLYQKNNQHRINLTEQVLEQNHIDFKTHSVEARSNIEQAFELLVFGSYTSFYLALLNNQNPTPNPWVDWFKAELEKTNP